jgi:hypothetical protein
MNRRLALTTAVLALVSARRAAAQESVTVGYQGLPYKVTGDNRATGINLAEGVLLHVGAGAEAGYDSNVYYGSTSAGAPPGAVVGSGLIRVNTFGELTNASRAGGGAPALTYDMRAGLQYRRYLSGVNAAYRDAFTPTAGLSLGTTVGTLALQLSDTFLRQEDPPYSAAAAKPISRDNNLASVQAQWSPGGGRISGTLRYTNAIDIFEQDSGFSYANSITHQFMLDLSWKWLPKTAIFFQANQGYVSYLSNNAQGKVPSYPLRIYAGLRGLVTPRISAIVALGYVNSFTTSGKASTSGIWGSSYIDLQAIYTSSMLSRLTVGYHQDFVNSVISSFYYQYSVYASYVQQLAGRVSVDISGRLTHQNYEGLLFDPNGSRTDNVASVGATADYFFRSWIYAGVGYSLTANISDYRLPAAPATPANPNPGPGVPVDYVKHQVFARLGVTY